MFKLLIKQFAALLLGLCLVMDPVTASVMRSAGPPPPHGSLLVARRRVEQEALAHLALAFSSTRPVRKTAELFRRAWQSLLGFRPAVMTVVILGGLGDLPPQFLDEAFRQSGVRRGAVEFIIVDVKNPNVPAQQAEIDARLAALHLPFRPTLRYMIRKDFDDRLKPDSRLEIDVDGRKETIPIAGAIVSLPPDLHLPAVTQLAEAGVVTWLEKPPVLPDEIPQLEELAAQRPDKIFAVDFMLNSPAVEWLVNGKGRRWLNKMGPIESGSGRLLLPVLIDPKREPWLLDRKRNGGGAGTDTGVHPLNAIYRLLDAVGLEASFNEATAEAPRMARYRRPDGTDPPGDAETYFGMKAHLRDPRTGRDIPLTLECGFGVGVDDFGVTLKAANFEIEIMTGSRTKPPSVAVTPRDGQKRVIKEFPLGDHGYVGTFKDFFALLRGKRAPSRLTLQKRLQAAIASLTLIKKAYRLAPEGPLPIYQFGTSPKVVFELLDLFQRHRTMGIEMAPGKFVTNDLGHGRPSAESLPGDYAEMQAALAYLEKNGIVTRRRGPDGHFYFTLDSRFFTIDRTPEAFRDEIQRLLQPVHAIRKDVSPIVESPSSVRALAMPGPFTWLRKHHLNFYNALRIRYPRPTFVLMLLTNLVFYGLVPATACDGAWTLARLNAPEGESPLFPGVAAAVKKSLHEGRFILVSGDPETNIERYFLGPLLHEAKLDPAEQKQLPVIALSGMDRYNYQDGEFRGHALLPGMTKEEWRQVKGVVAELLKEIEPQLKETAERLLKDSGKVEYELGFIKELNGISGDVFAYCRPINLTSDSGPVDWGPLDQNPQYRDLLDRFAADATRRIAACLGDMSSPIRAVRSAGHGVDFKRADKGDALNAVELGANEYWVYIGDQFAGGADDASLACRRALIGVQVGPVSESTRKFAAPAGRHLIISDREAKDGAAADYIRIITRVRRLARARARLFGIFRRHPLQNLLIRVAGGVTPDRVAEVLGRPERVAAALQSRATTVAGLEKEIESYRPVLPVVVENANAAVELSPIGNRVISYRRKQPDGSHFDVLKSPAGNKRGLVPTLLPHNRIRDGLVTGLDGHPLDLKWPGLKLDNGHLMHGFLTPDVVWKETGETGEAQDDGGRYHYVTYAADLGEILSDRPKVADYFGYGHITARHKLYEDGSYEQEVRFENRTEHATVFPLAFHNYQAVGERAVIQAPVIARYPLDAQHLPDGPATPELLNTDPNHPETPYNLQQGFPLGEHLYDELYLLDPNGKEADGRHHVRIRDEERGVEIDISADNATHLVLYYTNEGFVCPEFANIASNGLNEPGEKDRLPVVEPRGTAALRMRITVKPLKGRGAGDSEPGTGSSRTLAEEYARLCSRLEELSEHLQLIGQGLAGTRRAHEIYIETLRRRTSTAA